MKDQLEEKESAGIYDKYLTPMRHVIFQILKVRTREEQLKELERLSYALQNEIETLKVK